jgi:hypothetical protein
MTKSKELTSSQEGRLDKDLAAKISNARDTVRHTEFHMIKDYGPNYRSEWIAPVWGPNIRVTEERIPLKDGSMDMLETIVGENVASEENGGYTKVRATLRYLNGQLSATYPCETVVERNPFRYGDSGYRADVSTEPQAAEDTISWVADQIAAKS